MLYCKEQRHQIKQDEPGNDIGNFKDVGAHLPVTEVSKRLGEQWNMMGVD